MIRKTFIKRLSVFLYVMLCGVMAAMAQNPTDVTGYETVSVSIPATSYDASQGAPQMAPVKYNKTFPLVITSDDMGKTELTNNWAELNGYPVLNNTVDLGIQPGGTAFLQAPLKKYYTQGLSQDVADYAPMTYTDNLGKTQRYRMTCAIMPSNLGSNNYSQIDANDAKLMLRTGFSYAQHDVEDISSVEAITAKFKTNSDKWAQQVGIGLKVMVEPNGNHNYLAAAKESDEICWSIFQNNTSEYPFNSLALTDWTHSRSDWTNAGIGTLPSNFTTKPTGGYARAFFQGNESAWQNTVNNADGTRILIGGTHGLGNTIKDFIRTNSNVKNNAWVAGADEVWEYYHIYNNLKIENVNWDGSNLTFDVQVPTYKKNQFRELTLNIPGLTGGTAPTFSTASGKAMPVTGGYNATGGAGIGYTMNLGMESSITTHIDELMTIYRDDQNNEFVKRDLEYLIAQLWDGTTKSSYTTQLNAAPNYTYNLVANTGETLYTGKTDVSETRQHAVPRYIVQNSTLYETEPNASKPNYVRSANTTVASTPVQYTVKSLSSLAVTGTGALATPEAVLFIEGEDLDGVAVVGADYDINDNSSRYWAMATSSGAMGGSVISGTPVTITSALPRGKYKMVIGYGDSYKGQGTYTYTVNAGGTQVYSFNNSTATNQAVTEFTSSEFSIETGGTAITISSDYTSSTPEKSSRWIDYIYFVKTSSLEPIAPTAAIAASAGTTGAVKINNAITITGTATQNGGSNFSGTNIYRCSDSTGTIDGAAVATSPTETVTYQFTPTAAGTYYFKAVASDGTLGDGTSSVITITAVADIDTYTLNIIDKSGNTAMTATVASADLTADPLAVQYRSPFAKNYKYYNTAAEAQANSGTALTTTADFAQATIYVGYDVDSEKMGADKVHAIWANSRLMHMVLRLNNAHTYDNDYRMNYQKYDIADKGNSDITLHDNLVNTNYALLDNHYMWRLGTDPYNVVLQNVANSRYVKSTYNGNPSAEIAVANANTYCILYWQDKNQNSSVETSAAYCLLYDRTTSKSSDLVYNNTNNHYLACTDNDSYQWRSVDKNHGQYTAGSKFYISTMPEVTVNVLNSHGEVEAQIQAYNNTNATMPNYVPYSMTRAFTSSHALYYDAAHSDAVTMDGTAVLNTDKLAANNSNLYLTYTIDNSHWRTVAEGRNANIVMAFDSESDNVKNWYAIGFNNNNYYIQASDNTLPSATSNNNGISNLTGNNANTDTGKKGQWLLMGTPYNLQIINRYHGDGSRLGIPSDATVSSKPKVYAANSVDVVTTWEVSIWLGDNNNFFFRPQGAFNAQAPNLYLAQEASVSDRPTGGAKGSVYWAASEEVIDPSTVSLTAGSEAPYYVDSPITLTAVATPSPSGSDLVTSLIIEQETSSGVWETVTAAPAYAGSDVTGATKDPTTKAVTVTWQYIPAAAGTFNFRAHAVIDGNDQYSTDATNIGGSGSSLEIIASIRPFVVGSDNYTLILVDKSGNELYTESNVSASRVSELNSVSGRNGDPLNNDWRSPLVLRYNYYTTKADAQTNSGENLFDWTSTAATPTVYVGYQVSNDIDLNSSSFNSLSDLMTNRVNREGTDTKVRDASKFGKMYMLKFKMSEANYLEDGSDGVETTQTAANTIVYPYTNGDGPMYIYTDTRYQSQINNGASTRTRWPWYIISPSGDPYHVYVTSWQSSHAKSDIKTNYYSYLRTYHNGTKVVTNNVTDDPRTLDGNNAQIMPTEYMLLCGSGTDGLNYKLVTADAISSGDNNSVASLGKRQTVTSLEQYWRNNPTAQTKVGKATDSGTLTSAEETQLTNLGWSKYSTYVNAKPWAGGSKAYENIDHWYRTIQLGDGSLDIVETNIDGVLVLIDNHGWEVIRQPIVDPTDPDYAAVQAILKQYDSPMVKEYKFYATRNVDHKVSGYHKYNINNDAAKCLTESNRVTTDSPVTSLANYPKKYDSGALADLYVTYDVKEEYANSYTGAATEAATAASQFILRQGTKYAQANGTTISAQDSYDASVATYKWYLKPNFDIDKEMGYKYDVDINGKNINYAEHGTFLNEATTNTNYNNNKRQGFDPYNLRIQNVSTETYFTTNAKEYGNYAYAATYPLEGMKVTLTDATATVDAAGYESTETLKISNATFFAVQDANGNMRLMPRFDTDHVIEGFTALAQQAEAQSASDQSHAQTTLLYTPITYHIIDNSGADVFGALTHNGAGFAVAREYKSPMVAEYYFHASLADATNSRTASTKTSFAAGDEIYVSYKATDDFLDATKAWIIYGNKNYMHAVYRNGEKNDSPYARLWWMSRQHQEKDNNAASFTLTTMPFLSNAFAWQVGENADPYNATFLNKGAHRYMDQSTDGSNYQMGHLKYTSETPTSFAILYQSASGDDCVLYNRTKSKFVYSSDNNNDWRAGDSRSNTEYRLSITTLPQISINVVDAAGEVECSMEGYYKSGCTWDNSFTPFILERMYTSGHTFYYDKALTDAISGIVDDAKVLAKDSVFVKYTLDTSSWGVVDNTANTLKVMPSPNASNKINWYAVKVAGQGDQWFKAATTDLPSNLGNTSNTTATSTADENANKLAHWAFIGTPYNLKIVERYHGMFDYLGLSENAVDDDFAFIDDGTADITTWEVVTNVSGNGNTNIQIRPQRSLNGETPYLYLGWNGGRKIMSMGASTGDNYALNLTWVKETDAKAVTFKLYDSAGNAMSLNETALTAEIVGVTDNANWANLFNTTDLPRQYCTYTFYSDNAFTTSITTDDGTGYDAYNHKDIYVKWDYTEHAPVFSQGTDTTKYQYYVFANRATNNGYTTYTPDGGTMITGGEYTPNADTKVGVGEYVDNKNSHWAFVGNPYNFALYNRVGKYLKLAEGATIANNQNVDFTATAGDALSWCLPAVDWTDENQTLSDRVDRTADAFRLFYPKINGYNVGIGNTRLNAGSDNIQWGFKRIEYIVVPLTVYDSNMTVKDTQEYSVPYPETDGHVINGDKMIRGTYHTPNLKHGFCDYTYYDTYTAGSPATLSGEMPSGGFNVCGGTEQKKKEVYATYTVDEEMFLQPWLTYNITDGTKQHYSRISDYQVQQSVQTTATAARQDATKRYQWVFKGDPYNFQIANVSMDETEPTAQYPLGAKATGWADNQNLYLHVTNDVSTYHYNTFEIVEAEQAGDDGSGKYNIMLIHSGIDRYTGGIVYPKDGVMTMRVDAYANTWITPVVPQYNVIWQVIDGSGSDVVSKTVKNLYEGKVVRPGDMPEELKRHFCDYTFYYAVDNAEYTEGTTPALTDAGVAIDAPYTIYAKYTLDSGAPGFLDATPTNETAQRYWYEINYPGVAKCLYYDNANSTLTNKSYTNNVSDVRDQANYEYCRWALVGNPYSVQFYNKATGSWLTSDGSQTSLSATGTTFTLLDDYSGDLCAIYDAATNTYLNASAQLQNYNTADGTAAEFSNTYGVVKIAFVLHYSNKTLRKYDSDNNTTLDANASDGHTETIQIQTFQKLDKELDAVLPTSWKRAFCDYTFKWDADATEVLSGATEVAVVNQTMVDYYNAHKDEFLYVHVTYDYETNAPFKWSSGTTDRTGKYWYYLVNNHKPNGELGKMVYRDSSPKLRVSTALVEDQLYLSNFEWCVIGDPYGFKMLNHYDPDQRYDEYISVTNTLDNNNEGYQIEQQAGNDNCIYEMMPGQYSENFWMHPIYTSSLKDETSYEMSYVGHNYNGSAAIIPTTAHTQKVLTTNSAANFRLEIQSTATLAEYVKYAGFVGSLKYDKTTSELRSAAAAGTLTDAQKNAIRTLIDDPDENMVLMTQGYYRMVPRNKETASAHTYVRGYLDAQEKTAHNGFTSNLKMDAQTDAEYDPASIFWFESTTEHDNEANKDFPRYYVRTQGLNLDGNALTDGVGYKTCYENLGAGIMQLKISNNDSRAYINCSATSTEISSDQCFGHPWNAFNTSFYLQKVGSANENELPYRKSCSFANGTAFEDNDYYYTSFYVPYDILLPEGAKAYIGREENRKEEDDYRLRCYSVDWYYDGEGYSDYQELDNRFVPGGVPVVVKYEKSKIGNDDGFNATDNSFPVTLPNNAPTAIPDAMKGKHEDATNGQNNLHGSYLTDYVTGLNAGQKQMVYVFTKSNKGNIGFFFNNNTLPDGVTPSATYNSNTYILHNRIYYIYTPGGPLTSKPVIIQFMDEEPGIDTDIETIDVNGANGGQRFNIDDDGWYTLHGVRLKEKPSQRGVYIYKGRKVVVK